MDKRRAKKDGRGRPVGWRKEGALRATMSIRFPADVVEWLEWEAARKETTACGIVRGLVIAHKAASEKKGKSK